MNLHVYYNEEIQWNYPILFCRYMELILRIKKRKILNLKSEE